MSINRIVIDPDNYPDPGSYFAFDDMVGALQPMKQTTEVLERPGHRAQSIRLAGIRAPDSRITTVRYWVDGNDAILALASYVTLLDGNPYPVIQHGRQWGTFVFLSPLVQAAPLLPVAMAAGTIEPFPTVMQSLSWILRNTDPPDPGP
jgi:hypothetical protein